MPPHNVPQGYASGVPLPAALLAEILSSRAKCLLPLLRISNTTKEP